MARAPVAGAPVADPVDPPPDGDGHAAPPPSPEGPDGGRPLPAGFEHLGWAPSWRERLEAAAARASVAQVAAAAGALAVAGVVAMAVLRGPGPPPPELTIPVAGGPGDPAVTTTTTSTSVPSEAPAATTVVAHAAGAVARPDVYRLPPGARVTDLLAAAGGPVAGADLDRLNLAAPLVDGDRVFVPLVGQEVPVAVDGTPSPSGGPGGSGGTGGPGDDGAGTPVDVNRATERELEGLPGIGPALAQAVVAERERRGGFSSVEELLEVRGIGEAKLAALIGLVQVDGRAGSPGG